MAERTLRAVGHARTRAEKAIANARVMLAFNVRGQWLGLLDCTETRTV